MLNPLRISSLPGRKDAMNPEKTGKIIINQINANHKVAKKLPIPRLIPIPAFIFSEEAALFMISPPPF